MKISKCFENIDNETDYRDYNIRKLEINRGLELTNNYLEKYKKLKRLFVLKAYNYSQIFSLNRVTLNLKSIYIRKITSEILNISNICINLNSLLMIMNIYTQT